MLSSLYCVSVESPSLPVPRSLRQHLSSLWRTDAADRRRPRVWKTSVVCRRWGQSLLEIPSCRQVLDSLLAGNFDGVQYEPVLEAIANAFFLRGERPEIRMKHKNGQVRVYALQLSTRKELVNMSQANKRRVAARGQQVESSDYEATPRPGWKRPSGNPLRLTIAQQVGLAAALSVRHTGFNR